MAAQSIEPSDKVYQRLQDQYQEQCGRSPSVLIDKLNKTFEVELAEARKRRSGSSRRDLISDKTLRNFFNSSTPQSLSEKFLNYLCAALLNFDSYQAAEEHNSSENGVPGDWLEQYCKSLLKQFGTVRIPNMSESAELSSIYTEANFSNELKVRKNKSITELLAELEATTSVHQDKVAVSRVFSQYPRLMVWGPAGSGKTTALKARIADSVKRLRHEDSEEEKVPVFIHLRQFPRSESSISLLDAIIEQIKKGGINSTEVAKEHASSLLREGSLLLMMDGLDEVPKNILSRVQGEISNLVRDYPNNSYILTCRYGATNFVPYDFKEVEMTDFDGDQIQRFVKAWFRQSEEEGLANRFLIHLMNSPNIQELGKNPLMLTMLCTTYQQGYGFPKGASSLFYDATELYLSKWDTSRRIEHRNDIYDGRLSRMRRRNLFYGLSFDGMNQEEDPKYFWRRKELEMFIKDFMRYIPAQETSDGMNENDDAQAIIDALESQDSLLTRSSSDMYTFSYRSFQQYFSAMYIIEEIGVDAEKLKKLLEEHALKEDWREVLLFAVERSPKASDFFIQLYQLKMKQLEVGRLSDVIAVWDRVAEWAGVDSSSWRSCYLTFGLKTDINISHLVEGVDEKSAQRISEKLRKLNKKRDRIIARTPMSKLVLDLAVLQTLAKDRARDIDTSTRLIGEFDSSYLSAQDNFEKKFREAVKLAHELLPAFGQELDEFLDCLPDSEIDVKACDLWADQLRKSMITHLYGGQVVSSEPVFLEKREVEAFNNYLHLLELLIDCLSADVYCQRSIWMGLVDSLVLPPSSDKIAERIRATYQEGSVEKAA